MRLIAEKVDALIFGARLSPEAEAQLDVPPGPHPSFEGDTERLISTTIALLHEFRRQRARHATANGRLSPHDRVALDIVFLRHGERTGPYAASALTRLRPSAFER